MLHNFPLKRRFMTPNSSNSYTLSIQERRNDAVVQSREKPIQVADKPDYHSMSSLQGDHRHRDQLQPILRNRCVTVKARDPEKLVVNRFTELYTSLDSADVSIMCGRNHDKLKAHQFVLSVGSVYFRDALRVAQCKHPVIVVKNVTGEVMSRVLEYIYLGHVTLKSESELKQFLSSANYLLVFGIQDEQYTVTS